MDYITLSLVNLYKIIFILFFSIKFYSNDGVNQRPHIYLNEYNITPWNNLIAVNKMYECSQNCSFKPLDDYYFQECKKFIIEEEIPIYNQLFFTIHNVKHFYLAVCIHLIINDPVFLSKINPIHNSHIIISNLEKIEFYLMNNHDTFVKNPLLFITCNEEIFHHGILYNQIYTFFKFTYGLNILEFDQLNKAIYQFFKS